MGLNHAIGGLIAGFLLCLTCIALIGVSFWVLTGVFPLEIPPALTRLTIAISVLFGMFGLGMRD